MERERDTINNIVYRILSKDILSRSDDKRLIWGIYIYLGFIKPVNGTAGYLDYSNFRACPTPETITRARRAVVEEHPELDADEDTKRERRLREKQKGKFVKSEVY